MTTDWVLSPQTFRPRRQSRFSSGLLALVVVLGGQFAAGARTDGELRLRVVDGDGAQPLPARMHLRNRRGRPVRIRQPGITVFGNHFYFDGQVTLPLSKGTYEFDLETGLEYRTRSGQFEIERHADDDKTVEMNRFVDLKAEGWWCADLDVPCDPADLNVAMRAEQLDLVPTIAWHLPAGDDVFTWATEPQPVAGGLLGAVAGRDGRSGGGLLVFGMPPPSESDGQHVPTPGHLLEAAEDAGSVALVASPLAWELPIWLATKKLTAIQMMHRSWSARWARQRQAGLGRLPDPARYPGRAGLGRWSEKIYYHILNAGFKLPPTAGSGAGANRNHLGAQRVYVHCGDPFDYRSWWQGLHHGRVFVTNGPLLRVSVRGYPPGHTFQAAGSKLQLEVGLQLAAREGIEYLEIIQNGTVRHAVRPQELARGGGRLPRVTCEESGWFLVRVVTARVDRYEIAATGPYFVNLDGQPRVSRGSVDFFLDWLAEFEHRLERLDGAQLAVQQREIDDARRFWHGLRAKANAD